MRNHSIVADADPGVSALVARVLWRAGLYVTHLAGPWELDAAPNWSVALVVLGGQGRGTTAADVALALRLAGDQTPVLILADGNDPEADALADTDSTVCVVQKPVLSVEMAAAVRDLLGYTPARVGCGGYASVAS